MNSSNSAQYSPQNPLGTKQAKSYENKKQKAYICPCQRSYGSYPALYSHIKRKHGGKAPGQIIKPKPLRRRGRPFKYQLTDLRNPNPHKTASKHLSDYLNVQRQSVQEFPLKYLAYQNKYRQQFIGAPPHNDSRSRNNFQVRNDIGPQSILEKPNLRPQLNYQQNSQFPPPIGNKYQRQDPQYYHMQLREYEKNNSRYPTPYPDHRFMRQAGGSLDRDQLTFQHYNNLEHQNNKGCSKQDLRENQQFYYYQQQQRQRQILRQRYTQRQSLPFSMFNPNHVGDHFEGIYDKPFQSMLNAEMQVKFRPIEQGIIEFLEPILRQVVDDDDQNQVTESDVIEVSQAHSDEDQDQKQKKDKSQQLKDNTQRQVNMDKVPNQSPQTKKRTPAKKLPEFHISYLLQNQHYMDILKWLMSPPEQHSTRRSKQNYIQFSFRCCIVQFLDFINNFLQTIQYQQILLIMLFFCDNILASTRSFQDRPQPQIYEMSLYYNDFVDSYLPQLMRHMQHGLKGFYLFKEYKKCTGQLIMWMSAWISLQQYYHNKYYREMVKYEVQKESIKCMMYQRNYNEYITQGQRQDGYSQYVNRQLNVNAIPNANCTTINQNIQEKAQDNAQMIIITPPNAPLTYNPPPINDNSNIQHPNNDNSQDSASNDHQDQDQINSDDQQQLSNNPQSVQHSLEGSQGSQVQDNVSGVQVEQQVEGDLVQPLKSSQLLHLEEQQQ